MTKFNLECLRQGSTVNKFFNCIMSEMPNNVWYRQCIGQMQLPCDVCTQFYDGAGSRTCHLSVEFRYIVTCRDTYLLFHIWWREIRKFQSYDLGIFQVRGTFCFENHKKLICCVIIVSEKYSHKIDWEVMFQSSM